MFGLRGEQTKEICNNLTLDFKKIYLDSMGELKENFLKGGILSKFLQSEV